MRKQSRPVRRPTVVFPLHKNDGIGHPRPPPAIYRLCFDDTGLGALSPSQLLMAARPRHGELYQLWSTSDTSHENWDYWRRGEIRFDPIFDEPFGITHTKQKIRPRDFRHTWASPYKSVPGRSMMVLVRDEAAPFHPVIGIAALSSAAVAVTARDEKIGWTAAGVIEDIRKRPTARLAAWLQRTADEAIDEIYKVDFLEDEIVTPRELTRPTSDTVKA